MAGGREAAAAEHATAATATNANPLKLPRTSLNQPALTRLPRSAERLVETLERERDLVVAVRR